MASRITTKVADAKQAFTSKTSWKEYLQTPGHQAEGEVATYNDDLLPTPPGMFDLYIFEHGLTSQQNSEHGPLFTISHST